MLKLTPKRRVLFVRRFTPVVLALFGVFALLLINFIRLPGVAQAATANTINFQARLQSSNGAIVPDGYYNVEFKLYGAASGGTALWTEDYLVGAGHSLQTINGYLSANLGSQTAFSGINWDQQLWMTMNIGGTSGSVVATSSSTSGWDGEMNPRLPLTAVPYAFTAGNLATTSGSNRSTLSIQAPTGGDQNFVIQDQGAAGTYNLLTSAQADAGYIQLQASTPATAQHGNFNIDGSGIASILQAGTFDAATSGALNFGTTNATGISIGKSGVNTSVIGTLSINNSTPNATNQLTVNTVTTNGSVQQAATVLVGTGGANNYGLVIQQVSGQLASPLRIESSTGGLLGGFDPNGIAISQVGFQSSSSASSNTGSIVVGSGNAVGTSKNSGNVTVDAGTATGTAGVLNLGNANASAINIGHSGVTTTVAGTLQGATINATSGFSYNGTAGSTTSCTGGYVLQDTVVQGGIITGGTCVANGGGVAPTLQDVYDNSSTTPVINLSSTGKGLFIQDASTTVGGNLFAVQDSTGSNQYLAVTTSGISTSGTATATGGFIGNSLDTTTSTRLDIGKTNATNIYIGNGSGAINLNSTSTYQNNGNLIIGGTNASNTAISISGTIANNLTNNQYGIQNQPNFNPQGASLTSIWGMVSNPNISGSALNISTLVGIAASVSTGSGYTGTVADARGISVSTPTINGPNLFTNYTGIYVSGNGTNGGNTSGTITNKQVSVAGITAGAGTGGTMNNYGIYLSQPSGSGAGTTNNYGLYLTGNGGGSNNYSIYNNSTAASYFAGAIQGASATFSGNLTIQGTGTNAFTGSIDAGAGVSTSINGVRTYENVYSKGTSGAVTGTLEIILPAQNNSMLNFTIKGYDYTGSTGTWQVNVSGFLYTNNTWLNSTAQMSGNAPFTSVRLAYNSTLGQPVLLLGTTGTVWAYPQVSVTQVVAGYSNQDVWGKGYTSSFITSETGITSIATPALPQVATSANAFLQGGNSFGTSAVLGTNDSNSVSIETGGTTRFTIDASGDASFTGSISSAGGYFGPSIDAASVATALNVGTTNANAINIGGSNYSAVNIGATGTTGANTGVNIGTSTDTIHSQSVTIGSNTNSGSTTTVNGYTLTLQSSNAVNITSTTTGGAITVGGTNQSGTITIGQSTGASNTINIGNGLINAIQTINIGTSATGSGSDVVTIGSLYGVSATNIQGGTGNVNLTTNSSAAGVIVKSSTNSATAFVVQNSSSQALFTVDTSTGTITFGNGSNTVVFTAAGGLVANGTAQHVKSIFLPAEYAGAVLDVSGDPGCTTNNGTMTSGYDNTGRMNYYNWTSSQTTGQCYDVVVQVPIPNDFASWNGTPNIQIKGNTSNSYYAIAVVDSSGSFDANYGSTYPVQAAPGASWSNGATSALSGTYTAGDYLTIKIRLSAKNSYSTQLGNIKLTYNSKY